MTRSIGLIFLGGSLLLPLAQAGEKKAGDKNVVHYTTSADMMTDEFSKYPDKAKEKYQPMKPFVASIDLTGIVAKMQEKDIYLATDSPILILLRAKNIDGKLDGPTTLQAKNCRLLEVRGNTVILECPSAKLVLVEAKK